MENLLEFDVFITNIKEWGALPDGFKVNIDKGDYFDL